MANRATDRLGQGQAGVQVWASVGVCTSAEAWDPGIAPAVAGAYQPGGLKRPPIDVSKYATLSEEMKAKLLAALERQQAPKASAETRGGKGGLSPGAV